MKHVAHILTILSTLLLLVSCGRGEEMRSRLAALQAANQADSLLTDDSLALALCDYFDSHGTANERMEAHYLLGRTYADLGEAPAALNSYQDAADCADTTAADCNYRQLSRVYAQESSLFFQQGLMQEYLASVSSSIDYAWRAKDTLQALNESIMKVVGYDQLQQFDAVISLFDDFYLQYKTLYGEEGAARFCALPIRALLEKGEIEKARYYLNIYETKSGYFQDSVIEAGRESYYFLKGLYFLNTHQHDSAEYCFRKEMRLGRDYENQSMAARGLSLAFMHRNMTDSAARYSIYSYEMNDSAYADKATSDVARVSAQHRYSRHQRIALQERIKSEKKALENRRLYILLLIIIGTVSYAAYVWHQKKRTAAILLQKKVDELTQVRRELTSARQQENGLRRIILDKEVSAENASQELDFLRGLVTQLNQTIADKEAREDILNDEIASLQKDREKMMADTDMRLSKSAQYQFFQKKIKKCDKLNAKEFREIDEMVKKELPSFHAFVTSKKHLLNQSQYRLCLLFRLSADVKQAAALLCVSPSYVSKMSHDILQKLFSENGNGLLLKKKLTEISE